MNHTFQVHGMTCGHCELAVKKAVMRFDPQAKVEIDRPHNKVVIESTHPHEALAQVMAEEGYEVL
jgi:copper chaperone